MDVLLAVTLSAQLILFGFTAVSAFVPEHRVWPPPSRYSWQFYATWFLSWVSLSGAFLLAVVGSNTLGLEAWLRFGCGLPHDASIGRRQAKSNFVPPNGPGAQLRRTALTDSAEAQAPAARLYHGPIGTRCRASAACAY